MFEIGKCFISCAVKVGFLYASEKLSLFAGALSCAWEYFHLFCLVRDFELWHHTVYHAYHHGRSRKQQMRSQPATSMWMSVYSDNFLHFIILFLLFRLPLPPITATKHRFSAYFLLSFHLIFGFWVFGNCYLGGCVADKTYFIGTNTHETVEKKNLTLTIFNHFEYKEKFTSNFYRRSKVPRI